MFETHPGTSINNRNLDTRFDNIDLVSVIIPNYNQSQYVGSAINSVLNQTYTYYEIIVVDDGSTDNSREVLSKFDNKIRYIWQENKGLAGARNTGIQAARGEYIGLLDADDEWLPTYLEEMVSFADNNPESSVYYCRAQAMDADGKDLPQIFGGPVLPPEQTRHALLRANFIIPTTILMHRQAITQAGLFDQNLRSCEDWDLWLRLLPTHQIIGKNDILVKYRIHGTSLSTDPTAMQKATKLVVEKHFGQDDGMWNTWTLEKRRAYGGAYRYYVLTSIQKQSDWETGAKYLHKALQIDPSLATDLDLFYDIALGNQPPGFRGTVQHLSLDDNAEKIELLLTSIFPSKKSDFKYLRRETYGTAYFAIGLVAYNYDDRSLSRKYISKAIYYQPRLLFDPRSFNTFFKSYLSKSALNWLKQVKRVFKK